MACGTCEGQLFPFVQGIYLKFQCARALVAALEEEPNTNPATGTQEFALRDPDGYYVMVSALGTD